MGSQPWGRDPSWGRGALFVGSRTSLKTLYISSNKVQFWGQQNTIPTADIISSKDLHVSRAVLEL